MAKHTPPVLDRMKIANNAPLLLAAFDGLKPMLGIGHDEMLATIAAALASMPAADRAVFRSLYDKIEQEMTDCGCRAEDKPCGGLQ
jgi:hypothetical protein